MKNENLYICRSFQIFRAVSIRSSCSAYRSTVLVDAGSLPSSQSWFLRWSPQMTTISGVENGLYWPISSYIPKQNISGPGTCGKSEFQFPVELTAEVIWHIWHFESSDPCSLNIGSVWNRCDFNKCHYSSQQRIFQCLSQLFSPLRRTLFSQCAMIANLLAVRPVFWLDDDWKIVSSAQGVGLGEAKHVGSSWRCSSYCLGIVGCT